MRKIIAEELARALGESGVGGDSPIPKPAGDRFGLVCFSGDGPPSPSLRPILAAAKVEGWRFEALPSLTYQTVVLPSSGDALADLPLVPEPDRERGVAQRIEAARAVIFPDLSSNSLNKATLGIADSIPTRALAQAIRQCACILLETQSPPSAVVGLSRIELLRRLERRGALLADAETFMENLRRTGRPLTREPFLPLSGSTDAGRKPAGRVVVTADDVVAAAQRGLACIEIPARAIVTDRAREEARRRGIMLIGDEVGS